jgi:predicted RND superfamily exporter protein
MDVKGATGFQSLGIRFPWLTLLISTLLIFVMSAGAANLLFTTDFRTYFSDDNPQLKAFEQIEADFNKQDTLVFLVEQSNETDSILNPVTLDFIRLLTDAAWQIPYSRRVDSLSNFQRIESTDEEMVIDDLIPNDVEYSVSFLQQLESYINEQPRIKGTLVNSELNLSLIRVNITLPDNNEGATKELVDYARKMLADLLEQPEYHNIKVQLLGTAIVNLALAEAVEQDMAVLIPASYLLIFGLIVLLARSYAGTFSALTMTLLTVSAVFGLLGWLGKSLTPVVGAVPSMIMIIVIADCMHILVSYQHYLREGQKKLVALQSSVSTNLKPVVITSVTTAIGLLCLNFSESPPYRDLGNLVAAGALIAGLLSLTWFPALLAVLPAPKKLPNTESGWVKRLINAFAQTLIRNPKPILSVSLIALLLAIVGLFKLEFNEQWHQYYDESFAVRKALDTQNEKLHGVNFIQYSVGSGSPDGIYDVAYQQQLDALTQWIQQQPRVGYVDSLSAQVKEINRKLNNDLDSEYVIPDQRQIIAQSMLAYELSLPFGMGLEEAINIDKSSTRLTVYIKKSTSKQLVSLDESIRFWAQKNSPDLNLSEGSGLDMVFAQISDRNTESLIKGTALALVLISVLLIFILKSVRLGLISIVPNILPAVFAYGVWGFLVGRIDLGLSIVACMGLGLVVDDTVHFLSKYQFARQFGQDARSAVQYAFNTVGVAMLITSVVLIAGFALLVFSPFSPTSGMGALLSLTVLFAILIDFILLPYLLIQFDRKNS